MAHSLQRLQSLWLLIMQMAIPLIELLSGGAMGQHMDGTRTGRQGRTQGSGAILAPPDVASSVG